MVSIVGVKRRVVVLICALTAALMGVALTPHQPTLASTYGNPDVFEYPMQLVDAWWGGSTGTVTQRYGCTDLALEPDPVPPYGPFSQSGVSPCPYPYNTRWHQGIDVGLPIGTTLYSQVSGTVVAAHVPLYGLQGSDLGYLAIQTLGGHIIWLLHGSPNVTSGTVSIGSNIYTTGSNGPYSTGPHLHFEVERSVYSPNSLTCSSETTGQPSSQCDDINPEAWLSGFYNAMFIQPTNDGYYSGVVYRMIGEAPLNIQSCAVMNSSCSPLYMVQTDFNDLTATPEFYQPTTTAPEPPYPLGSFSETGNAVFIRGWPNPGSHVYRIAGGAPIFISSCTVFPSGICAGYIDVDQTTIDTRDHMNTVPRDSTYLRGLPDPTSHVYVVAGGYPILLSNCQELPHPVGQAGCQDYVDLGQTTIDTRQNMYTQPLSGTKLYEPPPYNNYWKVTSYAGHQCLTADSQNSTAVWVNHTSIANWAYC